MEKLHFHVALEEVRVTELLSYYSSYIVYIYIVAITC